MSSKKKPHYTDNLYKVDFNGVESKPVYLYIDAQTGKYNEFFVNTLQHDLNAFQYAKYRNALKKILMQLDNLYEDVELPFEC